MRKYKLFAIAMTIVMLMPMLMSCQSGGKKNAVVKADDPWFDSNRFLLNKNMPDLDLFTMDNIFISDNRLFYCLCKSYDLGASYETTIYSFDFDGKQINKCDVKFSDETEILTPRYLDADPEGKNISAIAEVKSGGKFFEARFDIDAETGCASGVKELFSGKAKAVKKADRDVWAVFRAKDYMVVVLNNFSFQRMEYQLLLYKNMEFVTELDLSTVKLDVLLDGVSQSAGGDSINLVGSGGGETYIMEFDVSSGKLKSKKSVIPSEENAVNIAEYQSTYNGDLCKIDSYGNIVKLDISTMTPKTVVDTNWYTPHFYSNPKPDSDDFMSTSILSCTDERTVILDAIHSPYGMEDYRNYKWITVVKKADKNPHVGKKIIELALPPQAGVTEYLSNSISEFNKTDNEYLIRIWNKYKSGFVMGREFGNPDEYDQKLFQMIQELKGGDAPDIIIGIQKNYAMRDDVFMDLTGLLSPEVLEKQYVNIFDAAKINGKQYFLPVTIRIEGLVTEADLLKDGAVGITFADFEKMVKEKLHGISPYDYPKSAYDNKTSFLFSCIDTKRAIEGDKIDFGTDQFRSAVEYAKANFQYDDILSVPPEHINDWEHRLRTDCYYARLDNYLSFVRACNRMKGHFKIIGTPSVNAAGPRFEAVETISVSAGTDNKEGCVKFLNYLFSGKAFAGTDCEFKDIVTNKEIMDKNIETLTRLNNEAYEKYLASIRSGAIKVPGYVESAEGDKRSTEDMQESFKNSMSTISTYYYEDARITGFVTEELQPYYAGDRSLDDVIKYVNDRTTKYVREM